MNDTGGEQAPSITEMDVLETFSCRKNGSTVFPGMDAHTTEELGTTHTTEKKPISKGTQSQ